MRFDAEIHTPQALTAEIAGIYSRAPDSIFLGSLGRAVIYNRLYANPHAEFEARGQTAERKVENGEELARDIDIIGAEAERVGETAPFQVDFKAFDSRHVSFKRQGEDWFLVSERCGIYEPLHPDVMQPVEGESAYGAPVVTVPIRTHLAAFGLKGDLRPKDKANYRLLEQAASKVNSTLPDELYEPFEKLRVISTSGWFYHTRRAYRTVVPGRLRKKLAPVTGAVREKIL
jgi:hypothetical protein